MWMDNLVFVDIANRNRANDSFSAFIYSSIDKYKKHIFAFYQKLISSAIKLLS